VSLRAAILALGVAASVAAAQAKAPAAPRWSVRMADATIARNPVLFEKWDYTAGLMLTAYERVGRATGTTKYDAYIKASLDRFVQPDGAIATYKLDEFNLDQINMGRALFPLATKGSDPRYRTALDRLRDQLRQQPRTSEGGFWHKRIYPEQMWLDGLYMAEPFYAAYAKAYGAPADFDDITKQFLLVARSTRDPATGLLRHAWDAARVQKWADPNSGQSPHAWGRAMGWYLMAVTDVLDQLPANHKDRDALIRTAQDLAEAVSRNQDPVSGLWYQVVDQPTRPKNYLEASASAMFVYAFARGVKQGWLPARYRAIAERGFDGLVGRLVITDTDGLPSLTGICKVAGLGGTPYRDGSYDYYVSEPVAKNDYKGLGPFMLAAVELGR
jgi:unsaturated rhamnogalacturonyl hydrolase